MRTNILSCLTLLLLLFACNDNDNSVESVEVEENAISVEDVAEESIPANMAPEFVDVLDAHGGLDVWNNYNAVSFVLVDFPTGNEGSTLTDRHSVNLATREHYIESDNYKIVTDGSTTWSTSEFEAAGIPPRMYQGASFYLMGMPFVFTDPGLTITYAGETEFGDETMDQFNVQVPEDLGDGGNDYQLYVNPTTHQLRYATWNLNYPAVAAMNLRQMATFDEWQDAGGLVVPSVVTLYTAEEIEPGTPGATFSFDRVTFTNEVFSDDLFTEPEDGIVDRSAD